MQNYIFRETIPLPRRSKFEERILYLESKTGLRNLKSVFENAAMYDEVSIILGFIIENYTILENTPGLILNSMNHIFSNEALYLIEADNEEYYYNMTGEEAIISILNKLINTVGESKTINGFPSQFNHRRENNNKMQRTSSGEYWFPFVNTGNLEYSKLYDHLVKQFNFDHSKYKLLLHGTSFKSALSINEKIWISHRLNTSLMATDFGIRNFYVTDTFYTACKWCNRNSRQPAIVFFLVPNEIFMTDNKLSFDVNTNLNEWKETVFKVRDEQTGEDDYYDYVDILDSKDYIEGPIYSNPGNKDPNMVDFVKYQRDGNLVVPTQISFKDSIIHQLNKHILFTLYFEDTRVMTMS